MLFRSGCTHYPLIRSTISRVLGEKVSLVNPAYETAKNLKQLLMDNSLESKELSGKHEYYVSDGVEQFNAFAKDILPNYLGDAREVNIYDY